MNEKFFTAAAKAKVCIKVCKAVLKCLKKGKLQVDMTEMSKEELQQLESLNEINQNITSNFISTEHGLCIDK